MAFFINKLKLKAAAGSMHEFCPVVRNIFPAEPSNDVVEAATLFLYARTAESVFGRWFARHLRRRIREQLKFSTPIEMDARVYRITRHMEEFHRHAAGSRPRGLQDEFTRYVHNAMRALLREAGTQFDRPEIVRLIFPRFEYAVRRVRDHLQAIKEQTRFVFRA
jgi:hypothetical protein